MSTEADELITRLGRIKEDNEGSLVAARADRCVDHYLTRMNKIAMQAAAHMAADTEAVGLSRVHVYESRCILRLRDNCLLCS